MRDEQNKNQAGSVLLFSLMLMLAVAVTGISLSVLLLNEVRSARYTDEALKAYYAAESGLEQSLDYLSQQRADKSVLLDDALIYIESYAATLSNNANYIIDDEGTKDTVPELFFSLEKDTAKQVDIFDPSDTFNSLDVEKVYVDWDQNCAAPGFNSRIEVSLVEWPETGWVDESMENAVTKFIYTCGGETPDPIFDCRATENALTLNYNYRLRIKSLDCDLPTVHLYLDDGGGGLIEIPGRAVVKSIGAYNNSEIALEAQAPWWAPATGLGDFVLFSETDLEK